MPRRALFIGLLLILIGAGGALVDHHDSGHALLVPSVFGLLLVLAGLVARRSQKSADMSMLLAALFSLLGFMSGAIIGVQCALGWAENGATCGRAVSQLSSGLLCGAFLLSWAMSLKKKGTVAKSLDDGAG